MTSTTSGGATETRWRAVGIEELLSHDGWSRSQLLAYQRARLHEVLEHAITASPYYREALGRDALDPELALEDLPTLPKAMLVDQFDRVLTDSRLTLAALDAHAAGPDPGALLPAGPCHLFYTSGTSGRRGVFPQTPEELAQWVAAGWRVRARIGLPPEARVIGIAAPTPLHITQKLFSAFRAFGERRPRLTVTMPLPELVQALDRDQPEALFTIPSMIGVLAEQQLAGALSIAPRRIVVAGEVLSDDVAGRVREAWGVAPFQVYASTEALMLAAESEDRVGLHVSDDLVVLEVVDERDRPVPPGLPGHKVLITSLVNRTLPLIRYELPDTVTLAGGPDRSGLPYTRIERIDGRSDDVLRLPAAMGGEAVILPHRLRAPFAQLPDVIQYQLIREPDQLVVRLVLRPDASSETPARVAAGVRAALEDAGALAPPIVIAPVTEIEREPGGAKLKLVKSL